MRKVIILSGISGVGKSTYARDNFPGALRFSADDFFSRSGEYKFDPTKLGEAHANCFKRFLAHLAIENVDMTLVVDNSNCEAWEIAPYVLAANAFGWEHEIITLFVPWNKLEKCADRNIHGVLTNALSVMFDKLYKRVLPAHWNAREIKVDL
jgi:predicted kinase